MESTKINVCEVYVSIVGFEQYGGKSEDGQEIIDTVYKLHLTLKDGTEYIYPVHKPWKEINQLKHRVDSKGIIDFEHWVRLADFERLQLVKFTQPTLTTQ